MDMQSMHAVSAMASLASSPWGDGDGDEDGGGGCDGGADGVDTTNSTNKNNNDNNNYGNSNMSRRGKLRTPTPCAEEVEERRRGGEDGATVEVVKAPASAHSDRALSAPHMDLRGSLDVESGRVARTAALTSRRRAARGLDSGSSASLSGETRAAEALHPEMLSPAATEALVYSIMGRSTDSSIHGVERDDVAASLSSLGGHSMHSVHSEGHSAGDGVGVGPAGVTARPPSQGLGQGRGGVNPLRASTGGAAILEGVRRGAQPSASAIRASFSYTRTATPTPTGGGGGGAGSHSAGSGGSNAGTPSRSALRTPSSKEGRDGARRWR